jgi:hypothetical protein
VHKAVLLVHSLWGKLWIEIFFRAYMPSDLRKHRYFPVDNLNLCVNLHPQP